MNYNNYKINNAGNDIFTIQLIYARSLLTKRYLTNTDKEKVKVYVNKFGEQFLNILSSEYEKLQPDSKVKHNYDNLLDYYNTHK